MDAEDQQVGALRSALGGVIMGMANLVPGISGGTMLLAVGVYPAFIRAVAEVSTLRFRVRSLVVLAAVGGGAAASIVAGAGFVKGLVVGHRWAMYSLFIGLTLGGVPVIWRLLRPLSKPSLAGAAAGFAGMAALAVAQAGSGGAEAAGGGAVEGSTAASVAWLLLAGIAGGAAMILPGVSGGYVLLVLGQYVVILGAIESARDAVIDRDWNALGQCMWVFVPVGVGVVAGVVGVSNVVKVLLDRFPRATLGFLMGLLLGAVVGLWPFQAPMTGPGEAVTAAEQSEYFRPAAWQVLASLGLIAAGLVISMSIDRLGRTVAEPDGES